MKVFLTITGLFILSLHLAAQKPEIKHYFMPVMFTENAGQWDQDILFASQGAKSRIMFTQNGIIVNYSGKDRPQSTPIIQEAPTEQSRHALMEFVDPSPLMRVSGNGVLETKTNFYYGRDNELWKDNVRNYRKVKYKNVWNNIDVIYEERNGKLQQVFEIQPGGRIEDIRIKSIADESVKLKMIDAKTETGKSLEASIDESSGVYSIRLSGSQIVKQRVYFRTEYSFNFGGSGGDGAASILLDGNGNIYMCGATGSTDLPLKNASYPKIAGNMDLFLARFDCNGGLIFCTYFGGSKQEFWDISMVLGIDSSVVIAGLTESDDIPITNKALCKIKPYLGYSVYTSAFSGHGSLMYSSYFYLEPIGSVSLARDKYYNIYIAGSTFKDFPFITKGVVCEKVLYQGGTVLAKLTPGCDSVIYGTFIGGEKAGSIISSIGVDTADNPIIVGGTNNPDFPTKNAWRDTMLGRPNLFIMKLNRDATDYIFSTFFGGCDFAGEFTDFFANHEIVLDKHGNIHLIGLTNADNFPLKNAIRNKRQLVDGFLSTISDDGKLLYSSYIGSYVNDEVNGITVDECGNRFITGQGMVGESLINPLDTIVNRFPYPTRFLAIINSAGDSVLLSSFWGSDAHNHVALLFNNASSRFLTQDENGYVYLGGMATERIPKFNTQYTDSIRNADAFLTRLHLPYCGQDYIRSTFSGLENIRFERIRRIPVPAIHTLTVTVRNTSAKKPALDVEVELSLPKGLILDPPNQDLVRRLTPSLLPPGMSAKLSWTVRVDTSLFGKTDVAVNAVNVWRNPDSRYACPLPISRSENAFVINYYDEKPPEIACDIAAPDTLLVNAEGTAYQTNPFLVNATIKNVGNALAAVKRVALRFPAGMGLRPAPLGDSVRVIAPLAPNESKVVSWQVEASRLPRDRASRLICAIIDTFGFEAMYCEKSLVMPGVPGIICRADAPSSLRYDTAVGRFDPELFNAKLTLENVLDTLQYAIEAQIDLSGAPRLALDAGEVPLRQIPLILTSKSETFTWRLKASGLVAQQVNERIVFRYRTGASSQWKTCERTIVLMPPGINAQCELSIQNVSITPDGRDYTPSPLPVSLFIRNAGSIPLNLSSAEITLIPQDVLVLREPAVRVLKPLQPYTTDTILWSSDMYTSMFERNVSVRAVTKDTEGNNVTLCEDNVFLPRIYPVIFCDLTAPDTLHYNVASDTYAPNPFSCSVKLENVLDTIQTAVEAEIDLSGAQHLELVSGETAMKQLPDIIARGQSSVSWNVTVKSSTDKPVTETILVRYRSVNEQEWKTCERTILIQGEKRIRSAKCSVKGHDTLWADIRYEDIIPQPAQIQYTIANTGNVPLTGCSAAIILPTKYELEPGCDSVQTYGIIPPGISISREWFIAVNKSIALPGADDIQWTWTCDDMTTDIPCRHAITLAVGIPHGITLTPWKLRFMAKQDGPLPASQKVKLWPGNGSPVFWQAQSALPWLDWQPQSGTLATPSEITVRPTTTAMPVGVYSGALNIVSTMQSTPPDVQVEYEIYRILNVERKQSPAGFTLEQNYPNPVSGDRTAVIRFILTEKSFAVLKLFDAFGRELATLHSGETPAGAYSIRLDAAVRDQLPSGVYYYTLNAAGRSGTRMMIVR